MTVLRHVARTKRPRRRVPAPPPPRRLPPLLRRAWYALNQAFRRRVVHLGITPDQYTVLRILAQEGGGGLTQRELSERMFSDPNTVTSLVNRMAAAGLLERAPHTLDRRAVSLRLSAPGSQRFTAAQRVANRLESEVLAPLGPAERERFLQLLERAARACQAALRSSPRSSD